MVKLQAAKCPQCNADIEVNPELEKTICQYCGTTILIQDAVQKLKVEHSGTVRIDGIKGRNDYLEQAKKHIKVKEYEEALKLLELITKDDTFDIEAYCNMIIAYVGIIERDGYSIKGSKYNNDVNVQKGLQYLDKILPIKKRLEKIDDTNEREKHLACVKDFFSSYEKMLQEIEATRTRREEILQIINNDLNDAYTNECYNDFYNVLNETMKVGRFKVPSSNSADFSEYTFDGFLGGYGIRNDAIAAENMEEVEKRFSEYQEKVEPLLSKANVRHAKRLKSDNRKRIAWLIIGILSLLLSVAASIGLIALNIEAFMEGVLTVIVVGLLLDTWLCPICFYWVLFSWDIIDFNKKR